LKKRTKKLLLISKSFLLLFFKKEGLFPFACFRYPRAPQKGTPTPMSLDTATVRRIAKLARIRLTDAEVPRLQGELNGILGWIEQLGEVNVDGVAPLTGGAQIALRMRADVEKILANAPDRAGEFFAVPKVVE
jgi:aspartyl-tRNA(Asn)/glutamyl-tRNA(Gln) amidotransferase subunit C